MKFYLLKWKIGGRRGSPPVWGAWVEIISETALPPLYDRRPPCGGRGLKSFRHPVQALPAESPPVWGAWVEIFEVIKTGTRHSRRPPCGGRGLKFHGPPVPLPVRPVAPRVGGVG